MAAPDGVIVAGAGPVGLTAGLLLHRAGIHVTLVEKARNLPDDLRASTFHPPTLDMLAALGVTDELIALGLVSPTWQIRMHPSGERALFDLSILSDVTDHPYRLQCTQANLCRILLDRLTREAADVRLGHELVAARQNETGVQVTCRAEDGELVSLEGAWLIGCDGARSAVRGATRTSFDGSVYHETTILATTRFPFHEHLPDLSNVNYVWYDGGTFSLLRLPDTWRCSLYPGPGETLEEALTLGSITAKLDRIVPGAGAAGVGELRPYRIHRRIAGDYRTGRMILAGDAAHLNSPSGGMGMNGGIHDAFELVESLRACIAGGDVRMMDRYGVRRRPIASAEIIEQAHQNRSRMQERDPDRRGKMLSELQAIASDPVRAHAHLMRSSMIAGLRQAAQLG